MSSQAKTIAAALAAVGFAGSTHAQRTCVTSICYSLRFFSRAGYMLTQRPKEHVAAQPLDPTSVQKSKLVRRHSSGKTRPPGAVKPHRLQRQDRSLTQRISCFHPHTKLISAG